MNRFLELFPMIRLYLIFRFRLQRILFFEQFSDCFAKVKTSIKYTYTVCSELTPLTSHLIHNSLRLPKRPSLLQVQFVGMAFSPDFLFLHLITVLLFLPLSPRSQIRIVQSCEMKNKFREKNFNLKIWYLRTCEKLFLYLWMPVP